MYPTSTPQPVPRALLLVATALSLVIAPWSAQPAQAKKEPTGPDDLVVVDCLLPQKVRRLGRRSTYLQPRKPIRTTAADCRIRGGEYTAPDQATYATSLQVWLPQAKAGDAEAQFYVGQIFERGLGSTPDPTAAAEWYRKSAEQSYAPAQVALGYLHEVGQGVAQSETEAMRWYRRAAGVSEDLVLLQRGEFEALEEARQELETSRGEIEKLEKQVHELRRQIGELEEEGEESLERRATLQSLVDTLETSLAQQQRQADEGRQRIASLEEELAADRQAAAAANAGSNARASTRTASNLGRAALEDLPFGDYHALVIGNSEYAELPALQASRANAEGLAKVLAEKYGFEVKLLIDADRYDILDAFDQLREQLDSRDNLLVYYAGHGERDSSGQTAYWQPVDASPSSPVNWIPSALVAEHLDLIAANHVFLVADSVFSGLRTRSSVAVLPRGKTDEERYFHVKQLLDRRARLVLASGSDPQGDGNTSFSKALVDALDQNDGLLEATSLYRSINEAVSALGGGGGVEFATLKWARHDLSDFFFVPSAKR